MIWLQSQIMEHASTSRKTQAEGQSQINDRYDGL
jgi:hypothetical protein